MKIEVSKVSTIGSRIKTMRMSRGLSRPELARRIGISVSAISMWENDARRPTFEMMDALADEFNVPLAAILNDEKQQQEDDELWELRETMRQNPNMRVLFRTAKKATPKQLKQAIAVLEALKASDEGVE